MKKENRKRKMCEKRRKKEREKQETRNRKKEIEQCVDMKKNVIVC